MRDSQDAATPEQRSAKRQRTSPETTPAKKKPAISNFTWCALLPPLPLSASCFAIKHIGHLQSSIENLQFKQNNSTHPKQNAYGKLACVGNAQWRVL